MRGWPYLRGAALTLLPLALWFLVSCGDSNTAPPVCQLSPAGLDFGSVTVGASQDRSLTVSNRGGGTLAGAAVADSGAFRIVGAGAYSLRAGESAVLTVRCAPVSAGALHGTVSLGSSACGSVACTATGIAGAAPIARIVPAGIDFGAVAVGSSVESFVTVTNVGGGTLSGQSALLWPECRGFSTVNSPAFNLSAGQSAVITVHFAPADTGLKTCAMNVVNGHAPVNLSGRGVPVATPAYVELLGDGTYTSNITSDLGLLILSPIYLENGDCGKELLMLASTVNDTTGFLLLGCHGCQGLQVDSTVYRVDIRLRNVRHFLGSGDPIRSGSLHAIAGLCDQVVTLPPDAPPPSGLPQRCDSVSVSISGDCLRYRSAGQMPVGLGFVDHTHLCYVAFGYARFTFQGMNVPAGTPVRHGKLTGLQARPSGMTLSRPRR